MAGLEGILTAPARRFLNSHLLLLIVAVLLAGTAALAGTVPVGASSDGLQSPGSGAPQFATSCPSGGAEAVVKTVSVTRPASPGGRNVSVMVTLQDSDNSPRQLYIKVHLVSGDRSQEEGTTVFIDGEHTISVQLTLPAEMPSDGFRVVVQLFSADQTEDCGDQEYEVVPGLPETFYRYWSRDGAQSFPVLVPADYFSPVEIARGIAGRSIGGTKHRENRIELYRSIALELAQKEPLQKNEYFEFRPGESSGGAGSETAADVIESCREVAAAVESSRDDVDPGLFCVHMEFLGRDSFFSSLPTYGTDFGVVFSEVVNQTIAVQDSRNTLRQLAELPHPDDTWRVGVGRASDYLTSDESLASWRGELKKEHSEIARAVHDLKRTGQLALEEGIFLFLKEGTVGIASHAAVPVPYVYVALYSVKAAYKASKFVLDETGNFWDDVSMASAAAQVYGTLQTAATAGDGSVDPRTLSETLRYTKFAYYQHLHQAAENALLSPLGLDVNLIFNLGENTPDHHSNSITRLRDEVFDDIANLRWNPAEDFLTPEVAGAQGIWSDGNTLWVLGRPTDAAGLLSDYRGYRLFAYDMRTKERVEEHELDDLDLSEPRGVWGDDSRIWITDSGSLTSPQDKIFAFDKNTGQRLSEPHIELGKIWLTGIWSQPGSDRIWYVDSGDLRINSVSKAGGGRTSYSEQRGRLSGARNLDPEGIWSDGETMWVADSERKRVFAYDFPAYWDRDIGNEFDTLDIPGVLTNASPTGIWSDGTTMWVADSEAGRIFAYDLKAPPRCVPGREPPPSDRGDGNPFSHNPSRDFECLPIAGDSISPAMWYDERGWMWVVDWGRAEIHALDATTRERVAGQVFDGLEAAGNQHPQSIWSDGLTMWVLDSSDNHIYAYGMHSKERERGNEFEVESSTLRVAGIWSNGTVMYVVDAGRAGIQAYDFATKTRNPDEDFNGLSGEGNGRVGGIWSDGSTMWVVDQEDQQIYAYDLETKERVPAREFLGLAVSGINSPFDLASDGTVMWVLDWGRNRIFSYNMPPPQTLTDEPKDTGPFGRNRSKEISRLAEFGVYHPSDVWSDGSTMWIANGTIKIHAFDLSSRSRVPSKDLDTSVTSHVWGDDDTLWSWPRVSGVALRTNRPVSTGSVRLSDLRLPGTRRLPGIWGVWSDGETTWATARVYREEVPLVWRLVLGSGIQFDRAYYSATDGAIVAYDADTGLAVQDKYFLSLSEVGNNTPDGIWSDGETLWVVDQDDAKIYAYNLATQERTPGKDFDTLAAAGNTHPAGIWSDGETMWVADRRDSHIYAYNMPPVASAPAEPDGGPFVPFSKNEWEEIRTEIPRDHRYRQDIWSDSETMWLLSSPYELSGSAKISLVAFDMDTNKRDLEKDIEIAASEGHRFPETIWAEGETMWVGGFGSSGTGILAYDIDSGAHSPERDLSHIQFMPGEYPGDISLVDNTLWVGFDRDDDTIFSIDWETGERDPNARVGWLAGSGNHSAIGFWTDGRTVWISDPEDDKLYAYELATGDRLPGKDFNTLRAAGNNAPDGMWSDGRTMWVTDGDDDKIHAYHMPIEDGARRPSGNLPGRPKVPIAASAGDNQMRLTWSPPDNDGGQRVTSYRIQYLPRAGRFSGPSHPIPTSEDAWYKLAVVNASVSPSYIHEGLLPLSAMHYRVAAVNSVGQGPWSIVVTGSTDASRPPSPPNQVVATPRSETHIELSWDPPSDTGGWPIESYTIEESEDGQDWAELGQVRSPDDSYSHTALVPESRHYYRVRANGRRWGRWSEVATAIATLASVPRAPRELSASDDSLTDIELTWLPPESDGGAAITAYQIQISNDGSNWRDLATSTDVSDATHADRVLERGGTRHYRVAATNVAGTGPWSNVATGTTDSEPAPLSVRPGSLEGDHAALVAFYHATGGPNWADNYNWLSDAPLGEWHGVRTDSSGRVSELSFFRNNLNGSIPAEIANLTDLRRLALGNDQLTGDGFTGPIPAEIGNLTNLRDLQLSGFQLTGPIPAEIGNLTNLVILSLSYNQLTGPIPAEIGNLTNLDTLYLQVNQLTGPIPAEIGNLTGLDTLWLLKNNLTGPIPSELGGLTNLETLYISQNQLTGCIPAGLRDITENDFNQLSLTFCTSSIDPQPTQNQSVGSVSGDRAALVAFYHATGGPNWVNNNNWLSNAPLGQWHGVSTNGSGRVTWLLLRNNQLNGSIPAEIGNLTGLENLELTGSQLAGPIPAQLGNLTNLERLVLFNNQLAGPIPAQLGNLTNLEGLSLGFNQLTGPVPAQLGNLTNLEFLILGPNQLTGPVPAQLGNLTNLEYLSLLDNRLTGPIPAQLGNLTNLSRLFLSKNQLTGTIPSELSNLGNLERLALGDNQLTGTIPSELSNLGNLERLALGDNQLTGTIPSELSDLGNLERLDLSDNRLTGPIPAQLVKLTNLVELYLGGNQFTGPIPAQLGNLTNLDALSLYDNQLTGPIPAQLGNLTNLSHLILSKNQLTGSIPPELGILTKLEILGLANNNLTGPIPSELGGLTNLEILFINQNQLTGCIPSSFKGRTNVIFDGSLTFCGS